MRGTELAAGIVHGMLPGSSTSGSTPEPRQFGQTSPNGSKLPESKPRPPHSSHSRDSARFVSVAFIGDILYIDYTVYIEVLSIPKIQAILPVVMKATKPKEKQYVNILFDDETLKRIDDFRFKNRFPSRNETVRWLLTWALDQKPAVPKGD